MHRFVFQSTPPPTLLLPLFQSAGAALELIANARTDLATWSGYTIEVSSQLTGVGVPYLEAVTRLSRKLQALVSMANAYASLAALTNTEALVLAQNRLDAGGVAGDERIGSGSEASEPADNPDSEASAPPGGGRGMRLPPSLPDTAFLLYDVVSPVGKPSAPPAPRHVSSTDTTITIRWDDPPGTVPGGVSDRIPESTAVGADPGEGADAGVGIRLDGSLPGWFVMC